MGNEKSILNSDPGIKRIKFLVIRLSSIGDIVLTTPAIRCLKQQVPWAEVHFLTKLSMKAVTEANPYIDRFHYFTGSLKSVIKELKNEHFDYIIDLHKNLRTFFLWLRIRANWLSYKKLSIQKLLLTRFGINLMPGIHISQRCLRALTPLGVKDDGKGLDYFIPPAAHITDNDLPASHLFGFIAIVIGGAYYTKKLPVNRLKELCALVNLPIVLVGGNEDMQAGEEVAASDTMKIYNACGKFGLNESADIVRRAKVVISHDTGLLYIACAFDKPAIAVWGGTSPKLDVEPYYGTMQKHQFRNFIVPGLKCQPCSNYGLKKCPKGHFKCMKLQDVTAIAKAVNNFLNKQTLYF